MVYPGACLMVSLPGGSIPIRIVEVYRNKRHADIKLFPKYKDDVCVSVNPIMIRRTDEQHVPFPMLFVYANYSVGRFG